jgi:hypothetical protein
MLRRKEKSQLIWYNIITQDSRIGRRVIKVSGVISASNCLEIPNKDYTKSLNYCGKYYYIYYKGQIDRKFNIIFTFVCNDIPVKINLKHPLNQAKVIIE